MLGIVKSWRDSSQNSKAITELHITFLGRCTHTWVKCEAIGDSCHLKHSVNSQHHKRLDTSPQYQPKLSQVPNLWKPDLFTKTSLPLYSMKPHPSSAKNQAEKGKIYKCYKDVSRCGKAADLKASEFQQ